jgi:suppressor of ftsI
MALCATIAKASGEKQFWRIVNSSPDLYADLEVDSESMTVLAFDGMPLNRHTDKLRHVLVSTATGRTLTSAFT